MTQKEPFLLWLLGPTSGGKTTLANKLTKKLRAREIQVIHYDGDEIRDLYEDLLGFAEKDRERVVKTLIHLANKTINSGINVIVSALTANISARELVVNKCQNLFVGYVKCGIGICIKRDPKGLYSKAIAGSINTLVGYNEEYKEPEYYDFVVDTELNSVQDSIGIIDNFLVSNRLI